MTPETDIIRNAAIGRPQLLAMRRGKFMEGLHWVKNETRRGRIEWTPKGLAALAEEIGVTVAELGGVSEEIFDGVVCWASYPNKTLIQAKLAGINERVLVRVRDAGLYMAGMEFKARRNGERGFMEAGRPKRKGRWR